MSNRRSIVSALRAGLKSHSPFVQNNKIIPQGKMRHSHDISSTMMVLIYALCFQNRIDFTTGFSSLLEVSEVSEVSMQIKRSRAAIPKPSLQQNSCPLSKFRSALSPCYNSKQDQAIDESNDLNSSRRVILNKIGSTFSSSLLFSSCANLPAFADETLFVEDIGAPPPPIPPPIPQNKIPMKTFIDPKGLFAIKVPQNFYTLRRTAKGDLPDAKTGKGRRGSSIFTAGDMAKAEVVAIERFPTRSLLEDEGYDASGDLSSFDKLGQPAFIAKLLSLKREKDKPGQSKTVVLNDSLRLSNDKKSLFFELRTDVDVQKPELLMEQMGVSELVRITLGRAELRSNDGQMMVCYASALDLDFKGDDGLALKEVVDSFIAVEQSVENSQ